MEVLFAKRKMALPSLKDEIPGLLEDYDLFAVSRITNND